MIKISWKPNRFAKRIEVKSYTHTQKERRNNGRWKMERSVKAKMDEGKTPNK